VISGAFIKQAVKIIASLLIACALGVGSALWAINAPGGEPHNLVRGAWHTNLAVGSSGAGGYTRAFVAKTGLFAPNKSETMYFIAAADDSGRPLRSGCDYRIEGQNIDARWWSITAYASTTSLKHRFASRLSYRTLTGRFRFINATRIIFLF